ncbi:MAG: hypothetical protein ACYCW6_28580, partial [Candidatus Xenobia bacterium]
MNHNTLRRWLLGLWAWWALCVALVGAVTAVGWYLSLKGFWMQTDANMEVKIRDLQRAFRTVQAKQQSLVLDLRKDVLDGTLTHEQLEQTRQAAAPFFKIYYVADDGQPVLPDDTLSVRPWMLAEGRQLDPGVSRTFFSVPAGMDLAMDSPPPDDYMTMILSGRASFLIADADLAYLYGPWLQQTSRLIGLDPARASRVDHYQMWTGYLHEGPGAYKLPWWAPTSSRREYLSDPTGAIHLSSQGATWERTIDVIDTGHYAFDGVKLQLD